MELEDNPLLKQENFFEQYNENIQKLKNNPALLEFDRLCYELFEANEMGKRFIEIITQRYLIPAIVDRNAANYQLMVIWGDGFKDFARLLIQSVISHKQRIEHEGKK